MIAFGAGLAWLTLDLARAEQTTRVAMRQKLGYAQGALEGLTLGRFDLVLTNTVQLRDFGQTNAFSATRNVDYLNSATNFSRRVDALIQAAKAENLEGATQAYEGVTRSCVECHKVFRRAQSSKGQPTAPRK